MKKVLISQGQTIVDVCLQECGTVEAIFDFCQLNGLNPDDNLSPGQEVKIPAITPQGQPVVDRFAGKQLNTGTPEFRDSEEPDFPEGINYWAIEDDFVVQPNSNIDSDL